MMIGRLQLRGLGVAISYFAVLVTWACAAAVVALRRSRSPQMASRVVENSVEPNRRRERVF
jgi:hypothetical protein